MNLYIETNLERPLMNMYFFYTLVRIFSQSFVKFDSQNRNGNYILGRREYVIYIETTDPT